MSAGIVIAILILGCFTFLAFIAFLIGRIE